MRNQLLALTASGLLLFGTCALAQDTSAPSPHSQTDTGSKKAKQSRKDSGASAMSATPGSMADQAGSTSMQAADKSFMMKAAEGGVAEVELGKLAADKASDASVKAFGQKMVDDHSKANDQLKSIAEQKGVTLPTDMSAKDKAMKDRLSKLDGAAFDRAYMKQMLADHKKDVSEFKKEASSGKDNDVKNFASQTVPTLEGHLQEAQQAASKVGAAAGNKKSNATSASTSNPQ